VCVWGGVRSRSGECCTKVLWDVPCPSLIVQSKGENEGNGMRAMLCREGQGQLGVVVGRVCGGVRAPRAPVCRKRVHVV